VDKPTTWVPALNAVFFQHYGFALNRGTPENPEAYYDPRNSFLPAVVQRRLGAAWPCVERRRARVH